ncbi:tyrosine-type recombinase/integrase, partial [Clostridium tyrobutyricum]|uniref:tyrosine-type recombinase/integrase n=1 Tax=Clostridium tyrobutyricum TaxID=1519 RepID=UPI0005250247
ILLYHVLKKVVLFIVAYPTYASKLFANNIPLKTVQVLLGHSNIKTTADVYTHEYLSKKLML